MNIPKLGVNGAGGRMGRRIVALACESKKFELVAALERTGHPLLGHDAGTVAGIAPLGRHIADKIQEQPEVMIDFSLPKATIECAQYCAKQRIPLVVGTTGLSDEQMERLRQAASATAVVVGANMSLGVNLLFKLVAQVAKKLDDSYDVEIVETHHRFKRDAPSGTALQLARQIASVKNWPLPDCLVHGREGPDALRRENTIGMHSVRAGDTVGEHAVLFAGLGETLELRHIAHVRDTFARGALHAARWVVNRPAGLYGMADVLGL